MIHNQRELAITKARVERLSAAADELERDPPDVTRVAPRLVAAEKDALRSVVVELETAIREYESLAGNATRRFEIHSLGELPTALIQARIAKGLTQRRLAEQLGLKEQQIQRYEATAYSSASLDRLVEIANALGVTLSAELQISRSGAMLSAVLRKLGPLGFDRRFLERRIEPPSESLLNKPEGELETESGAARLLGRLSRILGVAEKELISSRELVPNLSKVGLVGFRLPKGRSSLRTSAYLAYVHCIAGIAARCVDLPSFDRSRLSASSIRSALSQGSDADRFRYLVEHIWSAGVIVLPLDDSGAFNAASLRLPGAHIIVLKQPIRSSARWAFDLLHEAHHTAEQPDRAGELTIDVERSPTASAGLKAEERANLFAGDLLLHGQSEALVEECVARARGSVERLKSSLPLVARSHQVDVASLANYLAYRLSLQGVNWWGAAANLQTKGPDPYVQARDAFLLHSNLTRVHGEDQELLRLALRVIPNVSA